MIKEDLEKEMAKSKQDEAAALAAYEKLYAESAASMEALKQKKISLEGEIADTQKAITDTNAVHFDTGSSKEATDEYLEGLKSSCDWIDRTYQTRRDARKADIEGLQNAKSVLAGAAPGALVATNAVQGKHESVQDELADLS